MLAHSAYGKSRVRLVQVSRHGDRHDLRDLTIGVRFEGDYDDSYTEGDNSGVLPTDTMKNTVYGLAAQHGVDQPEAFGLLLAQHFLDRNRRLQHVRIDLVEHPWGRIPRGEREYGQAFLRTGSDARCATILRDRQQATVEAGVSDLVILKSSKSAFAGYLRDEFTTLAETSDRLLASSLSAAWRYRTSDVDFGPAWRVVRQSLLEAFAEHDSRSVQHTLHAMGQAVLDSFEAVASIRLVMPNKHHVAIDLAPFGLDNRNEVFVAIEEPHGLIEATLVR